MTSTASGRGKLLLALAVLACAPASLRAQQIYRSVDPDGRVVYSDHPDKSTVQPRAIPAVSDDIPPGVMHFCWTNCFTLTLENGTYVRADGANETWAIERFTPTSFTLHRHDPPAQWNGFSADVIYEGQVSNDRLTSVTIAGRPASGIQAAWNSALNTLPGSNAERDSLRRATHEAPPEAAAVSPVNNDAAANAAMSTTAAPPPLQADSQPPLPEDGYLWSPGYWGWGGGGYYWVPGVWVQPPRVGFLWTPGYWAFAGALYVFRAGYWGSHVGFYSGINYGYGYSGVGFVGGRWQGNSFAYNSTVSNVDAHIVRSTYRESVAAGVTAARASFNGPGGITSTPTVQERAAAAEPHLAPTLQQRQFVQRAASQSTLAVAADRRRPAVVTPHSAVVATTAPKTTPTRAVATVAASRRPTTANATPVAAASPKISERQPNAPKPVRANSPRPQHATR